MRGRTFGPLDNVARILSWGCGVQSTTLAVMSALGDLKRLDGIVHADTGWEIRETKRIRNYYTDWLYQKGLLVGFTNNGSIKEQATGEHVHMPFWTSNGGCLRRKCTRHFKITPIKRYGRELIGYHETKPPHPPAVSIEQWIGFSTDEYTRMRDSKIKFIVHRWPLIELGMSRTDCVNYLKEKNLPIPHKSSCLTCPYRSASEWLYIKQNSPDEWIEAVTFDESIRGNPIVGSTADKLYVYKKKVPLISANLVADAKTEEEVFLCGDGTCWT